MHRQRPDRDEKRATARSVWGKSGMGKSGMGTGRGGDRDENGQNKKKRYTYYIEMGGGRDRTRSKGMQEIEKTNETEKGREMPTTTEGKKSGERNRTEPKHTAQIYTNRRKGNRRSTTSPPPQESQN